ncbi:MAG: hypothetical protein K2X67_03515 [Burkholderiales bacterium]|nr:hypothetical protein [Burkholderiales bacterium]
MHATLEAPQHDAPALDDWLPIEEFVARHPNLGNEMTLRWQLRHRDGNGLASAVRRVGKRLVISQSRYARWLADGLV